MKISLTKHSIVVLVVIGTVMVGGAAIAASPLSSALASLFPTSSAITLPTLPTNITAFLSSFSKILGDKASTIVKDGHFDPNNALQEHAPTTAVADGIATQLGLNAANSKIIEERLAATALATGQSDGADNSLDALKQGNKMLKYVVEQQAQNTQTTQGLADLTVTNQYTLNEIKNASREQQIDAQMMSQSAKPFLLFTGN